MNESSESSVDHLAWSAGLLQATLLDEVVVFDTITETVHRLTPLGGLILSQTGPIDLDVMAADLAAESDVRVDVARQALARGLSDLVDAGLVGRPTPAPGIEPLEPVLDGPRPGWDVGRTHAMGDRRFAFTGPDSDLLQEVDRHLGDGDVQESPDTLFGLEPLPDGKVDLTTDTSWRFNDTDRLLWQLPAVLNHFAARSDTTVVLHSGAVRTPAGAVIVVTGQVDAGKSTLVAALVRSGCDYLGDESIGICFDSLSVLSYPKPLTLDPTSQSLVGLSPVGEPFTPAEHRRAGEIRGSATCVVREIGPIDLVVETAFRPDEPPSIVRMAPHEAIGVLLANTLNLARSANAGLRTLCHVAERVPVLRVTHGDSVALASHLVEGQLPGLQLPSDGE